ncbi:MAG: NAD(+)--dinitrogen-reductase ADP-D-ribosyltransferase [Gammaproteobacteria bacterium]|jgi:NAD+---dinitrogen-reductase ADP-D-ribosyltransferase
MTAPRFERPPAPTLPADARLPINHCNLPAQVLGSLTFQHHPARLSIDGIAELHRDLFEQLDALPEPAPRAQHYMDYMTVHFRLEALEDAGLTPDTGHARPKANYLRILRGWMFDSEGREGAVLKGWVESRFGLLARYHRGPLGRDVGDNDTHYLQERALGTYNTNALETQLDLLYTYCQYELARQQPERRWVALYRGTNDIGEHDWLSRSTSGGVVLLNNLNSFTADPERADEFGDTVINVRVPLAKVFYYAGLLPGILGGEDEHLVLGGLYEIEPV